VAAARRDYYEVLGLARDADAKAIRDAFRQLALKHHPDRNQSPGAEERFKEIAEAYAVLSDPKKRADYDAGGSGGIEGMRPEDLFGGIDFEDLFGGLGNGLGGGIFERFFGGHRRPHGPVRGDNLEVPLAIPLERVLSGGEETVRYERFVSCPACHGSRAQPGTTPRPCTSCQGSGREVRKSHEGNVLLQQVMPCAACGGRGVLIEHPCEECHGEGQVLRADKVTVRIPPGIEDGTALRVPGHGLPAPQAGAAPGDLYVVVHARSDPRFERAGADLWHAQDLALVDAVLGTELRVATLDGEARVQVPAGTQPDTILRLRGKGLPHFGRDGRGDLLLKLRVLVPTSLNEAQRSLYEQLRQLGH
jgi:molecular chaperone DnaJ